MKAITFQSSPAFLLDDQWNLGDFVLSARFPTSVSGGLSKIEERTPLGETLRLSARFSTLIYRNHTSVRNSLQALTVQRVLCPLWPAMRFPGDSHPVSSDYWLVVEPGLAGVVYATGAIPGSLPAGTRIVPLMVGRLADRPEPGVETNEAIQVDWSFVEDSDLSVTISAGSGWTAGPTVGGASHFLFPYQQDWRAQTGGGARLDVETRQIGEGRVEADAYHDQLAIRSERKSFTFLSPQSAFGVFRFFQDVRGQAKSFWLRSSICDARLTADVDIVDDFISVDNVEARGANQWFVLVDRYNETPVKVTGNSGSTWLLSEAVNQLHEAAATRIHSLILARFNVGSVEVRFSHGSLGVADISFVETPWELVTPPGESAGVTHGALPARCFLYTFSIAYPGSTAFYRFTDAETDLTNSGNTYTHQKISHGEIRDTLNLDRQNVQIETRSWPGNPLAKFVPFSLEWPMMLEICEADFSGGVASNLDCVFFGEVLRAELDAPYIHAVAASGSSLLDRQLPGRILSPNCPYAVYTPSPACGVSTATWEHLALVNAISGNTVSFKTVTKGGPSVSVMPAHYLAGGFVIFGTGQSVQYRRLVDNGAMSAGVVSATLAVPVVGVAANDPVKFYPGCDLRFETCASKFANGDRFGGTPHKPAGNPALANIKSTGATGGKGK